MRRELSRCLLLALMRPSPTADERPVLARNRTSRSIFASKNSRKLSRSSFLMYCLFAI